MPRTMNKHIIVGYLGQDPELSYIPSGTAICKLSISTEHAQKAKDGTWKRESDWHRCVVWGKQGEYAAQAAKKGDHVYVEGESRQNKFIGRDGVEKSITQVTASVFMILGTGSGASTSRQTQPAAQPGQTAREAAKGYAGQSRTQNPADTYPPGYDEDADIPF